MKVRVRPATTVLSAVALIGAAFIGVASPAAAAVPPYEPDPNSLGQIRFYNASGAAVTGGNLSDDPFAAYAVATTDDPKTANTHATLYGYTPVSGQNALLWSGEALTGQTVFPVTDSNAPTVVKTAGAHRPVGTLLPESAGGTSLATLISDFPNTNAAGSGYENLYQLRLVTANNDPKYWVADILVSGSTWTLVYPTAVVADNSSLTISKSTTIKYGASVTTSTTLKDSTTNSPIGGVAVQLQRKSGASWALVATVNTSNTGVASKSVKPTGNIQYRWTFAGNPSHKSATSPTQTLSVAQVVSAHSTKSTIKHGLAFNIWGTVNPPSSGQKVTLQDLVGKVWKNLATVTIKKQRLPNGANTVSFNFVVRIARASIVKYRVFKPATSTLVAGYSGTLTVRAT
jgi:5-hydroxyisourate hydrolase-like protein (transthyretin family)